MCELEGAGTQDRCGEGRESNGWPLQVPKESLLETDLCLSFSCQRGLG